VQAVWQGTAVGDNSLAQTISQLRGVLDADHPTRYIETAARLGYRFVAPVTRVSPRHTDAELDALLAPHRALVDGRGALETLEATRIARARALFEEVLADDPDQAMCHVGLANARVLAFEGTRTDAEPDTASLDAAVRHAREACRLAAGNAEAWATLGFVLERSGARTDAVAALRRAVALEPDNWRHYVRLAYGTWGEERLRAARRALELFPGCPMAHWLAASVYIARSALAQAEHEVDVAIAATDGDNGPGRFATIALHWLKGLLCLARGADDEALAAFETELTLESRGHVYAREVAANTWYAIGACRRRRGELDAARQAFGEALTRLPRHALAAVGLELSGGQHHHRNFFESGGDQPQAQELPIEFTIARAALLVAQGNPSGAAALVGAALAAAPPGNAGWTLPIEPLLSVGDAAEVWAKAVLCVRQRAV
jgi:tetratricopeptide (TPR) repeat protein